MQNKEKSKISEYKALSRIIKFPKNARVLKNADRLIGRFKHSFFLLTSNARRFLNQVYIAAFPASYIVRRSPAALMRSTEHMNRARVSDGFVITYCSTHFNREPC